MRRRKVLMERAARIQVAEIAGKPAEKPAGAVRLTALPCGWRVAAKGMSGAEHKTAYDVEAKRSNRPAL